MPQDFADAQARDAAQLLVSNLLQSRCVTAQAHCSSARVPRMAVKVLKQTFPVLAEGDVVNVMTAHFRAPRYIVAFAVNASRAAPAS